MSKVSKSREIICGKIGSSHWTSNSTRKIAKKTEESNRKPHIKKEVFESIVVVDDTEKSRILETLKAHFENSEKIESWNKVYMIEYEVSVDRDMASGRVLLEKRAGIMPMSGSLQRIMGFELSLADLKIKDWNIRFWDDYARIQF